MNVERITKTAARAAALLGAVLATGYALAQPPSASRAGAAPLGDATSAVLNRAIAALEAQRYAEAHAALAELDPDALSPFERSRSEQIAFNVAYGEKRYDEARAHLQRAIDAGGLNERERSQARYQMAQLFMAEQRWRDGAAALEQWLATAPSPDPSAYYLLAVAYYQTGDFDRALPYARQAVLREAEPKESFVSLLVALDLQRADYADAIPLLRRMTVVAPEKKTYWLQLSSAYGQQEDYSSALAILELADNAGLLTEDAEVRRLADLMLFNELPRRCAERLEAALGARAVKADAALYEKLGNCWLAAGEPDKGLPALERAAELSSTGDLFVRVGEAAVEHEDSGRARAALERAIAKGTFATPGKDLAYAEFLMGVAFYQEHRLDEARAWFERSLGSDPQRAASQAYLDRIAAELGTKRL